VGKSVRRRSIYGLGVTLDGRPVTALEGDALDDDAASGPSSPSLGPPPALSRRDPLARLRGDGGMSPVDTGRASGRPTAAPASAPAGSVAPTSRSLASGVHDRPTRGRQGRAGGAGAAGAPAFLSQAPPPPSMARTLSRAGDGSGVFEEEGGVRTGGFHTPSFRGSVEVL
jgi:hypothetical protein